MIVVVVGGMLSGVFTATESSAIAVVYCLVLGAVYRTIGLRDLPKALLEAARTTAIVMLLVAVSSALSWVMSFTRMPELMADAMAAYYGTHKQGLALNKKRVADALLSFYTVGDCQFDNPGHHGTPLQRERAADWGADLAAAANPQSYILPPATFVELFDEALSQIISGN